MKCSIRLGAALAGLFALAVLAPAMTVAGDGKPPQRKVTICHVTGSKTNPVVLIRVGYPALAAHKRHGDLKPTHNGKKQRECVPLDKDHPANGKRPQRKVTICHVTGSKTNPYVIIRVARAALPAHKRHGDHKPSYDKKQRQCVPPGKDHPGEGKRPHRNVSVCHVTGSAKNPFVIIRVGYPAVSAHMRHGDFKPSYTDKKHRACIPPAKHDPKDDGHDTENTAAIDHVTGSDTNPLVPIEVATAAVPAHEAHGDSGPGSKNAPREHPGTHK